MNPYRGTLLTAAVLVAALSLSGCGNSLDGGTGPSGSYIWVTTVDPAILEPTVNPDSEEAADTNSYTTVTMVNESAPNSETPTNSRVTMSRYRVDFTGLNRSVSIPSIDGGGQTVGIAPGGTGSMKILVMDAATLEYIREHYPDVGSGESLTLRAKITIWGEDSFKVRVQTTAEITLVVQ